MTERRRLPVLQNKPATDPSQGSGNEESDDENEPRPPWHWVGFGTVAIFAAWLPLAYIAGAVSAKMMASRFGHDASKDAIDLAMSAMTSGERARLMAMIALPSITGLAIASFGGGFVVGRWGSGVREAAYAGASTAIIASAIAWSGLTAASFIAAIVTFAIAILFSWWGGRVGLSKKNPSPS